MASAEAQQLLVRASALRQAGRTEEAITAYEAALALEPEAPNSWYNLGLLRRQAGRHEAALAAYAEALSRAVEGPEEVHLNRALILADHLARPLEAQAELEKALALAPNYVPALLNLGNLHEDLGRRAEARRAYERALAAEPDNALALARLAGVASAESPDDPLVERLRAALSGSQASAADRADLGFALGKLLDSAGAYDEAFAAYRDANAASRASFGPGFRGYDRAAAENFFDRLIAAFPAPAAAEVPAAGEQPVFICGMFRSGSTLAEQIIGRHPRVTPGGELDLLPGIAAGLRPYPEAASAASPEQLRALADAYLERLRAIHPSAELVTDKRPDNFLHIGLIKSLFPAAKIVHTVRNPLDNILSVYFLHLDPGMPYALDLEDTAHWHGQYRRLMAHWKSLYGRDIFDLDYDMLVAEPEPRLRALLDFLGLEWNEGCLAFHEAGNAVRTASAWQVREPLYRRSSGRWRHYEKHLGGVIAQLS